MDVHNQLIIETSRIRKHNMADQQISPEKITKPIQLLAAWLVGLIAVNGSFLIGAQQITNPGWVSGVLVVASVANVPIFIGALFLLQTKFRPQMQEDSYYSKYLQTEREYNQGDSAQVQSVKENDVAIAQAAEKIAKTLGMEGKGKEKPIEGILRESQVDILVSRFGGSRALAELYLSPATWLVLVKQWSKNEHFIDDIEPLLAEGLVVKRTRGYANCVLTDLGRQVAGQAEKQGTLWSQSYKDKWEADREELLSEA
jgi:hypothetical protein